MAHDCPDDRHGRRLVFWMHAIDLTVPAMAPPESFCMRPDSLREAGIAFGNLKCDTTKQRRGADEPVDELRGRSGAADFARKF